LAEQLRCPRAGGEDERAGLVAPRRRLDLDAVAGGLPAQHGLVLVHVGAEPAGQGHVRNDGPVRGEEACLGLPDGFEPLRQAPGRMASADLAGAEHLMRQPVQPAGLFGAGDDAARRQADVEAAGHREEALAEVALQRLPAGKRQAHQRHVARMLEVGEAEDARGAGRRAKLVGDGEPLQPEHAPAAPGELVDRRRAHAAGADDDVIEDLTAHGAIVGWRSKTVNSAHRVCRVDIGRVS
jgi:hypothetical protein